MARDAILPRVERERAPLSFAQERLWFLEQMVPGDASYHLALVIPLGGVSLPVLKRCLYDLTRRHEILRTTIGLYRGEPVQHVGDPFMPPLVERDLRGLSGPKRDAAWRLFSAEETTAPFDLTRGPLWRCCLYQIGDDAFVLQCVMHHIISDGWSLQVLEREIRALLAAYSQFSPSPLAPLPIQFGDYAAWQRERSAEHGHERDLDYWREQLRDAPALLELPFCAPRPARPSANGESRYFTLGADSFRDIKAFCEREATTPFTFFLSVFELLISKYTARDDIVIGVPVAGRMRAETAPLVGFFVNTLLLRGHVRRAPSFRALLRQLRETSLAAQSHQDVPFEKLVGVLAPVRSLDHNPLFQIAFSLETGFEAAADGSAFGAGLDASAFDVSRLLEDVYESHAKFDLTLQMTVGPHGLSGLCEYRTDLYRTDAMADFIRRFLRLAGLCVAAPDVPLAELAIADEAECRGPLTSAADESALASVRDRDGRAMPPEAPGRLYLKTSSDADWTPTEFAAVRELGGTVRRLGLLAEQVLVNGRRLNLAALAAQLRAAGAPTSLRLDVLREEGRRDALRLTATGGKPEEVRQRLIGAARQRHPWLAADLRCRVRANEADSPWIETATADAEAAQAAPSTATEAAILGAFRRVLAIERAAPEDNFFDLGGDSLRAFRVVAELDTRFDIAVPLMVFFENPTASGLAVLIGALQAQAANRHRIEEAPSIPHAAAPLSYGQEQIWLAHQMNPLTALYNVPFLVPLQRPIHVGHLRRALEDVVRRHAVLRSTFALDGLEPVQIPSDEPTIALETEDLSGLPPEKRWEAERTAIEAEAARPFDLENGPLLRARLFRFDHADHALMLTLHHIACDGRSAEILRHEITVLYDAFEAGLPSPLPDLPRQYADYCRAQRKRLTPARRRTLLRHWDKCLEGAPVVLDLPFAQEQRPPVRSNRGQVLEFELPEAVCRAVRRLAAAENATEVMVLLTCFKVLLHRYTGIGTLVVGTAVTDRVAEEYKNLIGYFANTVVLCTRLDGGIGFREALARVRRTQLDAYDHQDLPFEILVEERSSQRVAAHHPIFQIMFAFQPGWSRAHASPVFGERSLGDRIVEVSGTGTAKFDLTLALTGQGERFIGAVEYASDLFPRSAIERMIRHFRILTRAAMEDPDRAIGDLRYFDAPIHTPAGPPAGPDEAPAWLRRMAAPTAEERFAILAAPESPVLALAAKHLPGATAAVLGTEEIGDLADTIVLADASRLAEVLPARSSAPPRRILCFGGSLPDAIRRTWPEAWLGRITLFHGSPEHGSAAWIAESAGADPVWRFAEGARGFIGDARGHPVAPGVVGRILTARGEQSRVRAQQMEDGAFRILGKTDRRLPLRGRMVDLDAVERRLRRHPGLRDATVVAGTGRRSAAPSPGGRTDDAPLFLEAYLNPAGAPPTAADLIQFLRDASPTGVLPDIFHLVAAPLPRDVWGDIDEARLSRLETRALPGATAPVAAVTPRLAALRDLWAGLLGTTESKIEDNFFDLGGTSLIAMQILGRIGAMYGVEIGIGDFFAAPTLAGLDALIAAAPPTRRNDREPALVKVPRDPPPPLSFAQERLWFLDQFQPETPFYNVAEILPLGTGPDRAALPRALEALVARHEILRTSFPRFDGAPAQLIHPPGAVALKIVTGAIGTQTALNEAIGAEIRHPFDLETGPLFRATLLAPAGGEAFLLFTLHHIVVDAWSMRILKSEFRALYDAVRGGRTCHLPQPSLQYADYAVWERRRLRGARLDELTAHWRGVLENAPALLELPADRPRPVHQSFEGAALTIRIPDDVAKPLRALARSHNTTPFITYLSSFVALLHRLSGQADLVVGTPVANRGRPELEKICGFFANTVLVRSRTEPQERFSQMLDRIAATLVTALSHAEIPFEKLVEELQPRRDPSHNPLFQTMFLHDARQDETTGGAVAGDDSAGPAADTTAIDHHTAKFDLTLQVMEDEGGLLVAAEYARALFDERTVARWLDYYRRLLGAIAEDPDGEVAAIPLLSPEETAALTAAPPAAAEARRDPELLHRLFEAQAVRTPDAAALEDGDAILCYGALDRAAAGMAARLVAQGVEPGSPVGIHLDRSANFGIAVLAVLKAGGACLVLDPQYPQARLSLMLDDARPPVVLADAPPDWLAAHWNCLAVRADADGPGDAGIRRRPLHPEDPAYIVYTSGSTGRPKGVVMPHRALANLMNWQLRRSGLPAPRTLQLAPLGFDVAFQEMFATWGGGGSLVCLPEAERRDPAALLARIESARIERIHLPYVALDQLAQEIRRSGRRPATLRTVVTAGEALKITPDIAAWFGAAPQCRLFNQYGPAETHVVTEEPLDGPASAWPVLPPIGRPIDGTAVFIVDERLRPVPPGIVGEIVVAGKALARGYLNRPEETAARFVQLAEDGRAIYRTGDLGRLDGRGRIEFLGRRDQQVKIRGFRIEPGEIETVLKTIPGIADAVVVARGENVADRDLAGYVVPRGEVEDFDPKPVLNELRRVLPEHMRPGVLIAVPRIPLTPSGKQDRAALARVVAPAGRANCGQAPRTSLERRIAGIWQRLLRREAVGVTENFFELGGHSLLATRLVAQIGEVFHVDLPVRVLFDAPTIEALSYEIVLGMARAGRPAGDRTAPAPDTMAPDHPLERESGT